MSNLPALDKLFRRVLHRMRIVALSRSVRIVFLVCGGLYLVALLTSRLAGVMPGWFLPETLLVVPAAAIVFALLVFRRPTVSEAARRIDQQSNAKDLFLTLATLDNAAGDNKPLVSRDGEARAKSVQPVSVVPYRWERSLAHLAVMIGVLLAAVLWIPQLDPFGHVAAAQATDHLREQLADERRATAARTEQIRRELDDGSRSEAAARAIDELATSFREMKPTKKKQNFERLASSRQNLGSHWKALSDHDLLKMINRQLSTQRFGAGHRTEAEKWMKELQEGSTDSLEKHLSEMQQALQRMNAATDPAEKRRIAGELKRKLQDLQQFARSELSSQQLVAALERATRQLEAAENGEISQAALQAAMESMDLAKAELQEISRNAADMKALSEALEALQIAAELNESDPLDGSQCEGCQSMADYMELYRMMMAGRSAEGPGGGDRGQGRGGIAPEDDTLATDYERRKSRSQIIAGKVLLSLKEQGMSDTGEARKEYRDQLGRVRQGYSEAIDQENIPPGYVDGIRNYFDTIEDALADEVPTADEPTE